MATLNTVAIHYQPNSNPQDPSKTRNNLWTPKLITSHQFAFKKNIPTQKYHPCSLVPRCIQKPSEHDNEPRKAPEGLFASMKNRYNLRKFFELAADKQQSLHYDPLTLLMVQSLLKKQGSLVLSSLMAFIANHLEFVVKPTTTADGPDIGLGWNFELKKGSITLGPISGLYTTHAYSGEILLRNGKALIGPLLHLELLNKKMKEIVMPMLEITLPHTILRGEGKGALLLKCLLALFCMALSLILWKYTFM